MSTTPSISGVDRLALVDAVHSALPERHPGDDCWAAADAALAHIAAHHECACDREHADEWVEVDDATEADLPKGVLVRQEWAWGSVGDYRLFVHRDDLPDDPRALIARELGAAKAEAFLGLLDEHGWTVTRKEER